MALTKLNFGGKQQALVAANIPTVTGTHMPAGTIIKTETKTFSAFGNIDIPTAGTYVDIAATEQTFTRSISTSKILVVYNLKANGYQYTYLRLNRKIGSGSYAVVGAGASGTQNSRTSERQVLGSLYNNVAVSAMGYGTHADLYQYLDTSALGLTDSSDAISYKISATSNANGNDLYLNIDGYDNAIANSTTESSVTFYEIKV